MPHRRIGRPPSPVTTNNRHQISCVVPAGIKRKLLAASAESGRTVAGEVARRLEDSFDRPKRLAEIREALRAVLKGGR